MKRYRIEACGGYNEGLFTEEESETGDWVKYEDAEAELSKLKKEVEFHKYCRKEYTRYYNDTQDNLKYAWSLVHTNVESLNKRLELAEAVITAYKKWEYVPIFYDVTEIHEAIHDYDQFKNKVKG